MTDIEITGTQLTIENIVDVAYGLKKVKLAQSAYPKMIASMEFLHDALAQDATIYGVNTNFGGMAGHRVTLADTVSLQENLIIGLKCGIGNKLPLEHVRAGMLIRANSLARGVSGIRPELVERICFFLNENITPVVYDQGSIGASGDLVPLAYIAGSITGLSSKFKVVFKDKEIDAITVLKEFNLSPISLQPKEGLALVNGTSMLNGIAAICFHEAQFSFNLNLYIHSFLVQALQANDEAFDPFVHQQKPFKGQLSVAEKMQTLLNNSPFIHSSLDEKISSQTLLQDRYSIRCLPQYLGAIADGFEHIKTYIECEANSTTDNPLIDVKGKHILHAGNFLGQHISIAMDQLRYYLALMVKHLDVQIALAVSPEFNHGLPGSLAYGNGDIKFGLKGLQICANSIMPQILHLAQGISLLFPTHAEQFNQNINSQGFASANLSWRSIELTKQYLSISLLFAIQAIEQRCYLLHGSYDCTNYLSSSLVMLYKKVYLKLKQPTNSSHPLIHSFAEQDLEELINILLLDLKNHEGVIRKASVF